MTDNVTLQRPTEPAVEPPAGWEGILDRGENILWQGDSEGGVLWRDLFSFQTVFGIFFAGFAVFWISMAASMTGGRNSAPFPFDFFPLFGIPFVCVGLYLAGGRIFYDAYKRRGTHNTLTDRAAYVATRTFGRRKLERTGIEEMTMLELEDGTPGSVWFGEKITHSTSRRKGRTRHHTHRRRLGFEQVSDPRRVYGLLRDAQREYRLDGVAG